MPGELFSHFMCLIFVHFVYRKKTAPDKVLLDKVFNIAKHAKYYGYERGLASLV